VVLVVDELADSYDRTEGCGGLHLPLAQSEGHGNSLILAPQRPSVNVIRDSTRRTFLLSGLTCRPSGFEDDFDVVARSGFWKGRHLLLTSRFPKPMRFSHVD
jgi:hypothetical protein